MNRKTKKKLKQEIRALNNEVTSLHLRLWLNEHQYHQPQTYIVKATVPLRECLYPEHAYPRLRNLILRQLEDNIDEFIETYRDEFTGNHVAYFEFIPICRKDAGVIK